MKTSLLVPIALLLVGCDSGPRVVVDASLGGRPVADLPFTLLPNNRDRLLDSLRRESADDAPALPQEVAQEIASLDSALARVPGDSAGLRRADSLRVVRTGLAARMDTARAEASAWEARLAQRADSLGMLAAEAAERSPAADTTDAAGRAVLSAGPGQSWLRASYVLPEAVMEWNVPVTLPGGQDSTVVRLDERNGRRVRG